MTTLSTIRTLWLLHRREAPALALVCGLWGILFTATWIMLP